MDSVLCSFAWGLDQLPQYAGEGCDQQVELCGAGRRKRVELELYVKVLVASASNVLPRPCRALPVGVSEMVFHPRHSKRPKTKSLAAQGQQSKRTRRRGCTAWGLSKGRPPRWAFALAVGGGGADLRARQHSSNLGMASSAKKPCGRMRRRASSRGRQAPPGHSPHRFPQVRSGCTVSSHSASTSSSQACSASHACTSCSFASRACTA